MALRDQPYIPLYIQDIMTDEKLNECSAATHGIYIKGIMCLMHKSEDYGKILLKQKHKQNTKQSKNFASMLVKHLPYSEQEIEFAIDELIREEVCYYEGDFICQKRMIEDNRISNIRAKSGSKGGNFAKAKSEAKTIANTEYENEIENRENIIVDSDIFKMAISNVSDQNEFFLWLFKITKIPEAICRKHFTGFCDELLNTDNYKTGPELKSHFKNWLKKNRQQIMNENGQTTRKLSYSLGLNR